MKQTMAGAPTPTPASFPPSLPLPTPSVAARHIATEASILLTSLRNGPPHVSRGELAGQLHHLRGVVRGMVLEGFVGELNGGGGVVQSGLDQGGNISNYNTNNNLVPPPPLGSAPTRSESTATQPTTTTIPSESPVKTSEQATTNSPLECPPTPTMNQPKPSPLLHPNTPTPHAVPSSPGQRANDSLLEEWPTEGDNTSDENTNISPGTNTGTAGNSNSPSTAVTEKPINPGPYALPFLSVIIDPRFSGPHTLVALRCLHRLISRGSIVQLCSDEDRKASVEDRVGSGIDASDRRGSGGATVATITTTSNTNSYTNNSMSAETYPFTTSLHAIALSILSCRFEQTDAGADEAVEMAIADLLGLLVKYDGEGVRRVGICVVERVRERKRSVRLNKGQTLDQSQLGQSEQQQQGGQMQPKSKLRLPRLPTQTILSSFHAVYTTRQTFVGTIHNMGHYSPALSHHFEQVLTGMIYSIFGGQDGNGRIKELTSRHVGGMRCILDFLVGQILNGTNNGESDEKDGRALCLRLIQCAIKTGWGNTTTVTEEDERLLKIVKDDLCLALLTTGQAVWDEGHDVSPSASTEVLSEVCSTLSLLWSLDHLRTRLHSQFVAIFSGFYQRALSLLRKRMVPEDGIVFQANIVFDLEAEVILESLVDILCLHEGTMSSSSLSTLEELFGTYDCCMTELDVASGLLVELSLCCGGSVDEEGEAMPLSAPISKASSGAQTPLKDNGSGQQSSDRYRPVPDHLKELCSQALLGCIKQICRQSENINQNVEVKSEGESKTDENGSLRRTKEKKRVLHHAAKLFNDKPSKGIQYLLDNGILPNPVTPESVSSFLRTGLVVGLDKAAVGQYLGEKGKAPAPDKNPPVWDLESFHKDVLAAFCASFAFENQSLLDGLRMFLATFRLPGEAQMIDRILQGFSESCGCSCEESVNGSLKLFSKDEKRASDAAYLLSFSIIMLNTDLHNDNIRADRKMTVNDFVKNNTNYGKEISDSDLPREYLETLYNNIKTNQIRTLGEGADGSMTVERWKDTMRNATSKSNEITFEKWKDTMRGSFSKSTEKEMRGVRDLKELLLESSWQPIFSAVAGLWGMNRLVEFEDEGFELIRTGRLRSARLGIELAYELLSGASGRPDIFQDLFTHVCSMTGLLGEYNIGPDERCHEFIHSIERQSALIVAMRVCLEHGDVVGLDGWKCVWGMVFELRDLQLLSARGNPSLMTETDLDLLSMEARQDFSLRLATGDAFEGENRPRQGGGLFGSLFRAVSSSEDMNQMQDMPLSVHCKDIQYLWNEFALSDEEDDNEFDCHNSESFTPSNQSPIGVAFHNRFASENASGEHDMPVTGLERMDNEGNDGESLRARVRDRLSQLIDFYGLISESRFLDLNLGLSDSVNALVEIIHDSAKQNDADASEVSDSGFVGLPLSPASEALAEILVCEITLKNRDRFAIIWETILSAHYNYRLSKGSDESLETIKLTPGIEKCCTSVLRMCAFAINRNLPITSEVLATLNILHPPLGSMFWSPLELNLDKHLSEGIWRVCQNVDGLSQVNARGWEGILGSLEWCASRGGLSSPYRPGILADDDPSLQAFRSLHLLLHANELKDSVPPTVVTSIRCLVEAGERANSTRLSIAGLDLLQVLHLRLESSLVVQSISSRNQSTSNEAESGKVLARYWLPILEAIAEPAEKSRNASVRQQAISLLTDALLDRHGSGIPLSSICGIINGVCIPLAEKRITDLLRTRNDDTNFENTMVELELCISLLFKPLLHYLKALLSAETEFIGIWISLLGIMTQLLGDEPCSNYGKTLGTVMTKETLLQRTKELGSEHLRNAVMVLFALGVLAEETSANEISSVTWAAIGSIGYCTPLVEEWKQSAMSDTGVSMQMSAEA